MSSVVEDVRRILAGNMDIVREANRIRAMRKALVDKVDNGATCPCCGTWLYQYRRGLNSGMARSLIEMYRAGSTNFIQVADTIGNDRREEAKLRFWGLVENSGDRRDDGAPKAGYWRVTALGEQFVLGAVKLPKYAVVVGNQLQTLEGPDISIQEALGNRFDYDELMGR